MKNAFKQQLPPEDFSQASLKAYEMEKHLRHFCNSTSSELSTALGSLYGQLEYAVASQQPETLRAAVKDSFKALNHLMLLSRNLRYFVAHTRLDMVVTDFSNSILSTLDLFEKEFQERGIQIVAFVESGLLLRVDPLAMGQVLHNLLRNASDSMQKGGKLTVSLSQNRDYLEVCISDTGKGIAAKEIENIFEPYSAEKGNIDGKGTQGLCLSVCKALIEAHGGDVVVRSTVGKGTNFIVRFPYDPKATLPESYVEKRRFQRIPILLSAELSASPQDVYKTLLTTLSVGGCFVKISNTLAPLKKDCRVSLKIFFNEDSFVEIAKARVVNIIEKGAASGLGIEFLEVDSKAKQVLQAIVKSHSP